MSRNYRDTLASIDLRLWGSIGAFLLAFPLLVDVAGFSEYMVDLANLVLLLSIFALGFNLLFGRTGLLSFGHSAYYGVGGYTVAMAINGLWIFPEVQSIWLLLAMAVLVSIIFAAVFGLLCVQRGEIYFAMLTLAFAQVIFTVSVQFSDLTGGTEGLVVSTEPMQLGGFTLDLLNSIHFYYFTLAFLALTVILLVRVYRSPYGQLLAAIRENPERANFVGIPVKHYQWSAFIISGAFAGLAGGLFVLQSFIVTPNSLHWTRSADPLLASIIGGTSTFFGPVVGSAIYVLIRELFLKVTRYWQVGVGITLILIVLVFPKGVVGTLRDTDVGDVVRAVSPRGGSTEPDVAERDTEVDRE